MMTRKLRSPFNKLTLYATAALIGVALVRVALADSFPTNNKPDRQIRFDSPARAEARRDQLIKFIWNEGLPAVKPRVTLDVAMPNEAIGISPFNVARIDCLDVDVSGYDFHSISYLFHPKNTSRARRVVIVHHGHSSNLEAGVGAAANHLLQNGFTVLVMKMPLYNWSGDKTATIPGSGEKRYRDHNDIIFHTGAKNGGLGFRLFLEPIVQCINHIVEAHPQLEDVNMVGLSGGGWATSLMAALDKRIKLNVPIAGSAPLYIRNIDDGSVGDAEQYFAPLYDENIRPDGSGGGAATWLEIYALGGFGEGRRQIQVTNEFDSCCFAGKFSDTYKEIVTKKVAELGAGQWEHVLDSSHHAHLISRHIIATVINPAFGIATPVIAPSGLPMTAEFNGATGTLPNCWSKDPAHPHQTKAVEKDGMVKVHGAGLAAIVADAPINPQTDNPITITMKLHEISADNFAGVFLVDDLFRGCQLGVLFNPSSKELAVNADNGNGFTLPGDRVVLATIADYPGGETTMSLTFDADGFLVTLHAGEKCRYHSGERAWTEVPNGFNPKNLGDQAQVIIQSFDTDGGDPASLSVDSLSISNE